MDFSWSYRGQKDRTVLTVTGEIDLHAAASLEGAGHEAMDAHGPCLVVDFSGVTFMDASGITALLRLRSEATARGGFLRLDRLPERVLRILVITGTDEVLLTPPPALVDLSTVNTDIRSTEVGTWLTA